MNRVSNARRWVVHLQSKFWTLQVHTRCAYDTSSRVDDRRCTHDVVHWHPNGKALQTAASAATTAVPVAAERCLSRTKSGATGESEAACMRAERRVFLAGQKEFNAARSRSEHWRSNGENDRLTNLRI